MLVVYITVDNPCSVKTQQETETEFLRHSDTISAFLNELGVKDTNLVTKRAKALKFYLEYCDFYGLEIESEKRFTQRLKETPKISLCKIGNDRAWK